MDPIWPMRADPDKAGPVQVGSTWHNVWKIAGVRTELTYTLQQLTAVLNRLTA